MNTVGTYIISTRSTYTIPTIPTKIKTQILNSLNSQNPFKGHYLNTL